MVSANRLYEQPIKGHWKYRRESKETANNICGAKGKGRVTNNLGRAMGCDDAKGKHAHHCPDNHALLIEIFCLQ
jgi:hypothetical protein